MLNFFKNFGKGVLYVLVLPFLIVGMAWYAVFALFVFIYLAIKSVVLFFSGRSLYEDLPEDREAKKRIAIANGQYVANEDDLVAKYQEKREEVSTQKQEEQINKDPFYIPDYLKTEEDKELLNQKEETPLEQFLDNNESQRPTFDEEPSAFNDEQANVQETPKEEIITPKSSQNDSILEIHDDDDMDDDNDSGVKIDFN